MQTVRDTADRSTASTPPAPEMPDAENAHKQTLTAIQVPNTLSTAPLEDELTELLVVSTYYMETCYNHCYEENHNISGKLGIYELILI